MTDVTLPREFAVARSEPRGLAAWLMGTDHKHVGLQYMVTALVFFCIGASIAITMRLQTIRPGMKVLSPEAYNRAFSIHGTTMIFLFAMPILIGFANYLVPLMIGARDMAFPRLNALSYWLFLFGGLLLYSGFLYGGVLDTGWFSYAPLTERAFSPHDGVSVWIVAISLLGISSVAGAVNFIMTMMRLRAPGMTWLRMPLFCQATFVNSFLILFAFPSLTVAVALLYLDRFYHTGWYNPARGGDPIIWEHLFWFFGHPEVYILILPAFGMMSEIVPIFSRKPLFGRTAMVISILVIGFLGFLVWAHHMFTAGLPTYFNTFMSATSMLIAIPTGVKIFNWLATMYRGRIHFSAPMYFFMGFIFLFTIGGVAGVMLAMPAIDYQLHNSLFLVAHFHTMIVSGVVFGDFAGLIYWLPKIIGFKMDDRLLKYSAWCWIVGFVLAFGPLYLLGFMGATRRTSHYASDTGWQPLFAVAGLGVVIIAVGVAIMLLQLLLSVQRRKQNRDTTGDPWNGRTLEWSIPSPAPVYNFAVLPVVEGRDAFWAAKQRGDASGAAAVRYVDILLPANTPAGLAIGMLAFVVGFALIWQMYWATPLAILAIIVVLAIRTTATDDSERVITAAEVEGIERSRARADLA